MSDILEEKLDNVAIPYLKFVINPDSFAQTIENIFYFAFLIKEGKVALEIETDEESEHFGDAVVCKFTLLYYPASDLVRRDTRVRTR